MMTGKERTSRILQRKSVDRIGVYEHFWGDTAKEWAAKGWIDSADVDFCDLFDYDMTAQWAFNLMADMDFVPEIIEETEDTILARDGNGAMLRRHKKHDTTPDHVDFLVKSRENWEKFIKPRLLEVDEKRINFEGYRQRKAYAAKADRFFCWSGVPPFELMHPVCGHEYMLMGMIDDPEWIMDMCKTYTDLILGLQEILFAKEGKPDGVWYYEDLGFKERPFMSPAMYRELLQPSHTRLFNYAHAQNLPVIVHSCGYVEPLLPGLLEAGMDMLQVIEVKAGMDLLKLHKMYGDRLSFMGGIDVRALYSNDRDIIYNELKTKIPTVMQGYGYVLHSDHSIPNTVDIDSYRFFIEEGKKMGTY